MISGIGVVTHAYEGSAPLEAIEHHCPEPTLLQITHDLVIPVGRLGRIRRHPFRRRFEKMSQLDAFGQYAFIAAGHALDQAAIPAPDPRFETAGVIMGSCFGCQEANAAFDRFVFDPEEGVVGARPVIFKNTVDNVPAGWVSLAYGLRGVNQTFTSGAGAGAEALTAAIMAIQRRRARQVLAGGVERVIRLQIAALHRRGALPLPFVAEGAAVTVFEASDACLEREHTPMARVEGWHRFASPDPEAITTWLRRLGRSSSEIARVSLVAASPKGQEAARAELEAAGMSGPFLVESERWGEMFAPQAPLALALLVERLRRLDPDRPSLGLLHVTGEPGDVTVLLIESA